MPAAATQASAAPGMQADEALLAQLDPSWSDSTAMLLRSADAARGTDPEKELLRSAVGALRNEGRYDAAAVYAARLAGAEPSTRNQMVAGALFRNATALPAIQADSALFSAYSERAVTWLSRAAEQDSTDEEILIEWGIALIESRAPGAAMQGITKLRKVLELNPKNEEAAFRLGLYSLETRQMEKAEARFRSVLEINPQNHLARYYLAETLRSLGNVSEFRKLMTEVAAQSQDTVLAGIARDALLDSK